MACHTLTFRYVFVDAITRSQTYVNTGGEGGMSSSPPSPRKKWEKCLISNYKKGVFPFTKTVRDASGLKVLRAFHLLQKFLETFKFVKKIIPS